MQLDYKDIIIKHYALSMSGSEIARQTGFSKSGVNDFLRAFKKCEDLSYPLPAGITNYGIALKVYGAVPGSGGRNENIELPDYEDAAKLMATRKNMTLMFLWNRYKKKCEEEGARFYQYSQYCELYNKWCEENYETAHFDAVIAQKMEVGPMGSVLIGRHHTYSEKFYYKCKNRRKLARLCENKYSYDYSEVMDSVFSVIRQHMSLCVEKTKFVQKMNSRKENVLQYDIYTKQIAKLQNDVRRITANKSGLYEDYREQLITAEELCQYQREYESRVNEIEAQITELLHRRSLYEKEFHIDEGWEETVNKYMAKRKLTKELVDAFVSEIVFYDGNIEVKLLYDDFLKELLKVAEEREVSSNG